MSVHLSDWAFSRWPTDGSSVHPPCFLALSWGCIGLDKYVFWMPWHINGDWKWRHALCASGSCTLLDCCLVLGLFLDNDQRLECWDHVTCQHCFCEWETILVMWLLCENHVEISQGLVLMHLLLTFLAPQYCCDAGTNCQKLWSHMSSTEGVGVGCQALTVNSSLPNDPYMPLWIGSALVQIMTCCLFCAKPLSKPILGYCQLDPQEQHSVKFETKYKTFHARKCTWKCRLRNVSHLVQGEMS